MTEESESLITEEMRGVIGVESEPGVIEVEKETIRRVADALGDTNPLWRDEEYSKWTSHGGIIAFPIAFHPSTRAGNPMATYDSSARGGAVAGDEWEFFESIRPGDTIILTTNVVDFFERDGRDGKLLFTVTETKYKNQHNRVVMVQRRTGVGFGPRNQ
ncbi:MaoC family dehydratase [SAR202 cluster bacterium AC-647-N09_OGT_505m]|nr:MaoC family dehydratase [SAR202 cluster bacterium AC-647-N09_OGT_505m]